MFLSSDDEISISVLQKTRQSESAKLETVGEHSGSKLAYIPYSCALPGQSELVNNVLYTQPVSMSRIEPSVLTERGLHRDGRRLLRLLAQAKDVDSLDPKHVALSRDQSVDHEPETRTVLSCSLDVDHLQVWGAVMELWTLPVLFEGFVVTGKPVLGSNHATIDVVPHQVLQMFGCLPLHKHGRLGVPGCNYLPGSRRDACSQEKQPSDLPVLFSGFSTWIRASRRSSASNMQGWKVSPLGLGVKSKTLIIGVKKL